MTEEEQFEADEEARIAAMHKTAPARIWLQVDPDSSHFGEWDDTTWCSDRMNASDVEYVRVER